MNVNQSIDNLIQNSKGLKDGINYYLFYLLDNEKDMLINYSSTFDYTAVNNYTYITNMDLTTGGE